VTTRIGTGVYGIVTSPNNPDGRQYQPSWGHSHFGLIWDAAYASPAYGWNGFWTPSHAKVFSLSKLFGVPGLRVGWVLFDDEAQAADARAYVEVTTSGVNVFAQSAEAASILTHFGEHPKEYERFCRDVRRRLEDNRTTLDEALLPYVDDHGARTGGMYYWCLVKKGYWRRFKQALAKADIGHVPGEACGAGMSHLYRFNLAQDRAVVKEAAAQLAELMRKP
jgi:aspartate/methionine/tyrosine aminotransferase